MGIVDICSSPLQLLVVAVLVVAVILLVIYLLYSTGYAPYQILRLHGVPQGPTPIPFLGSYLELKRMGYAKFHDHLYKNYGPVVGFYIGRCPVVFMADLELIKEITVKSFDNFMDRPDITGLWAPPNSEQNAGLFFEKGDTWKKHRQMLSPTFSAMKLRVMVPLLKRSSDNLLEKLGERVESNKSIDVLRMYKQLTVETILATALGCVVNVQKGEGDKLGAAIDEYFTILEGGNAFDELEITTIMCPFWWLAKKSKAWQAQEYICRAALELVKLRRAENNPSKHKDLLQLMLDARGTESNGEGGEGVIRIGLSDTVIACQSAAFLSAGAHTSARVLSYASYQLALYPDIQERLRAEINDYFYHNPDKPLYEAIQDLHYLDMVVQETLRLSGISRRFRLCVKTTDIGGFTIPKGTAIHIASGLIHHHPDYWPDPYKFDPGRFTPEEQAKRPPVAFLPFGWGPRNCIGMRFGLLQVKLVLMEILRKYTFVQSPETEVPLEFVEGFVMSPKNGGIYLRIEARD